ncbi:MAG TPA: dienelactone hydrolase family protein [Caulobacteraceae bacterium]|jgi:carboxymethylenebutenolidase
MVMLRRPEGHTAEELKLSRRGLGKAGLGSLFFGGYAVAALSAQAEPVTTDAEGLITAEVSYPAPDGFSLPAYVARPPAPGKHPVVVVASEIFGVHEYIRDICRRLAKEGYVAVAPAFFVRVADPAPLTDMAAIRPIVGAASQTQVMGDVGATLDWLKTQDFADACCAGITGFCWGGHVTWVAAATHPFKAGVAWYGGLAPAANAAVETPPRRWPVMVAGELNGPVIGNYAEIDQGIPLEHVELMRAALAANATPRNAGSEIKVYPGVHHGFHADYRPSYDAAAAADGWARLLAHFRTHLR